MFGLKTWIRCCRGSAQLGQLNLLVLGFSIKLVLYGRTVV